MLKDKYEKEFCRIPFDLDRLNNEIKKTKNPKKQKKLIRKHLCGTISVIEGILTHFYPGISEFGEEKGKRAIDLIIGERSVEPFVNEKGESRLLTRDYYDAIFRYNQVFGKLYHSDKTIANLIDLLDNYKFKTEKEEFCYLSPLKNEKLSEDTTISLNQ